MCIEDLEWRKGMPKPIVATYQGNRITNNDYKNICTWELHFERVCKSWAKN